MATEDGMEQWSWIRKRERERDIEECTRRMVHKAIGLKNKRVELL